MTKNQKPVYFTNDLHLLGSGLIRLKPEEVELLIANPVEFGKQHPDVYEAPMISSKVANTLLKHNSSILKPILHHGKKVGIIARKSDPRTRKKLCTAIPSYSSTLVNYAPPEERQELFGVTGRSKEQYDKLYAKLKQSTLKKYNIKYCSD